MNSKFTEGQIEVYASHFREGDAIFVNNNWERVIAYRKFEITTENDEIDNSFLINRGIGVAEGFRVGSKVAHPYRVTTLENYKLQGDEKIVWLGESDSFRTFGKTYEVDKEKRYCGDDGISLSVMNNSWGVIPKYEQVSKQEPLPYGEELEQEMKHGLEHVVHYPTAADREEEVLKIKTFDLLNDDMSKEDIIADLKEIAHIEINNGNYDTVSKVVELIKEWEQLK